MSIRNPHERHTLIASFRKSNSNAYMYRVLEPASYSVGQAGISYQYLELPVDSLTDDRWNIRMSDTFYLSLSLSLFTSSLDGLFQKFEAVASRRIVSVLRRGEEKMYHGCNIIILYSNFKYLPNIPGGISQQQQQEEWHDDLYCNHVMPARPPLTHFLCIPLLNEVSRPLFERSLCRFRIDVLGDESHESESIASSGDAILSIDSEASELSVGERLPRLGGRAVRPAGSLHLTLGVMSLAVQEKGDAAISLLQQLDVRQMMLDAAKTPNRGQSCKDPHSHGAAQGIHASPDPIVVSLVGLQSMHNAKKTSILYAAPMDTTNRLYPFCQSLQAAFKQADLLVADDRTLKLHATVVNTIYSPKGGKTGKTRRRPLQFDATALLGKYESFEWAKDVKIDRIAICKMGAQKGKNEQGEVVDEAYEEIATRILL